MKILYILSLLDKRKKKQPKYKLGMIFLRTADKRIIFSKIDTTNWSYNLYKITEIIDDTIIPSYKLENFSQNVIIKIYYKNLQVTLIENNRINEKIIFDPE